MQVRGDVPVLTRAYAQRLFLIDSWLSTQLGRDLNIALAQQVARVVCPVSVLSNYRQMTF